MAQCPHLYPYGVKNVCVCNGGKPSEGDCCPKDGITHCDDCKPGYHIDDKNVCRHNVCKCPDGTAVEPGKCKNNGKIECLKCDANFKLVGIECLSIGKQCKCTNGKGLTGYKCAVD